MPTQAKPKRARGNLPQALILLRRRLKLKQNALARKLGWQPGRISQYERGFTEPDFATLRWMLEGMGFDLHDLQDALDGVAGRPAQENRGARAAAAHELLADILHLFAMKVAKEIRSQAAAENLKPRTRRAARSSRGRKVASGD